MPSEEEAKELIERRRASKETEAIMEADGSTSTSHAELQSAGKHLMSYEWRARLEDKHGISEDSNESEIRIPVILRADGDGSLAALRDSIVALGEESSHDVIIDPIQTGIGPVVPADVELAKESNAAIICFNVKNEVAQESDGPNIQVLSSEVIYSILEEAKVAFGSYLPPIPRETVHGRAKVAAIFNIGGLDTVVAGLQVTDGTLYRDKIPRSSTTLAKSKEKSSTGALYRVIRNGEILEATAEGLPSTSLKHFKEDVTEVGHGKECGLSLANFNDIQEGDEIECWSKTMEYQTL
jgi:translation initiation factor IF-2